MKGKGVGFVILVLSFFVGFFVLSMVKSITTNIWSAESSRMYVSPERTTSVKETTLYSFHFYPVPFVGAETTYEETATTYHNQRQTGIQTVKGTFPEQVHFLFTLLLWGSFLLLFFGFVWAVRFVIILKGTSRVLAGWVNQE